jgi:hypothetical protein
VGRICRTEAKSCETVAVTINCPDKMRVNNTRMSMRQLTSHIKSRRQQMPCAMRIIQIAVQTASGFGKMGSVCIFTNKPAIRLAIFSERITAYKYW